MADVSTWWFGCLEYFVTARNTPATKSKPDLIQHGFLTVLPIEGKIMFFYYHIYLQSERIERHQLQQCSKYYREYNFDVKFVRYVIKHL